jgi:sensor histidine kinase YesM
MVFELEVRNKTIDFKSKNTKRDLSDSEQKLLTGIGIRNIKKRLEYLYLGKFSLEIQDTEKSFRIHLKIQDYEN